MSTALTNIFGSEIKVAAQPRAADRQFVSFAGAHGLTGMLMGSRGYPIVVKGTLRGTGGSYSAARLAVQAKIDAIENYMWSLVADYTFNGRTYSDVVWNKLELLPDNRGSVFR